MKSGGVARSGFVIADFKKMFEHALTSFPNHMGLSTITLKPMHSHDIKSPEALKSLQDHYKYIVS